MKYCLTDHPLLLEWAANREADIPVAGEKIWKAHSARGTSKHPTSSRAGKEDLWCGKEHLGSGQHRREVSWDDWPSAHRLNGLPGQEGPSSQWLNKQKWPCSCLGHHLCLRSRKWTGLISFMQGFHVYVTYTVQGGQKSTRSVYSRSRSASASAWPVNMTFRLT